MRYLGCDVGQHRDDNTNHRKSNSKRVKSTKKTKIYEALLALEAELNNKKKI
jgi:hypothetical protein